MRNTRAKKRAQSNLQQPLFQGPSAHPVVAPEVLREVHAALVEMLLEAAAPSEKGAADECQDL
jgi:hypothetical protein